MKRAFLFILISLILLVPLLSNATNGGELIRQGSKGDAVVRIQKRLFDLGFFTYKPTGSFQAVTRTAVVKYQVQNGLMSDGTIAQSSLPLLFSNSAQRTTFTPTIPLTYSGQSGSPTHRGKGVDWYDVKSLLTADKPYQLTNCYTGQTANVYFLGGAYHAEMQPVTASDTSTINGWVGSTNSYYKCAVLVNVDNKQIAASVQWGNEHLCVYFTNSKSHASGLIDVEHATLVALATDTGAL